MMIEESRLYIATEISYGAIILQEYAPFDDNVAPHESWQMEQLGTYPTERKA